MRVERGFDFRKCCAPLSSHGFAYVRRALRLNFGDPGVRVRRRQTERRGHQPHGGTRDGRPVATRAPRLRDGQLLFLHVIRDAPQLLRVQHFVPGDHHAVQVRVRRTERQHHVVEHRLADVHEARELIVAHPLHQGTCETNGRSAIRVRKTTQ